MPYPIKRAVRDLKRGDLVDLEGDRFADPQGNNPMFQTELMHVTNVTRETEACTAVAFEGWDVCGFPPDHVVTVGGRRA